MAGLKSTGSKSTGSKSTGSTSTGLVSTASSFRADLAEMESALLTVGGLISDNFGEPGGGTSSGSGSGPGSGPNGAADEAAGGTPAQALRPLSQLPFQHGAASDLRQVGSAALEHSAEAEADGGAGTFYGLDFQEAAALDRAHGTVLESLLTLRASIEKGIQTLRQNLRTTHQMYSSAEEQISLTVANLVSDT